MTARCLWQKLKVILTPLVSKVEEDMPCLKIFPGHFYILNLLHAIKKTKLI